MHSDVPGIRVGGTPRKQYTAHPDTSKIAERDADQRQNQHREPHNPQINLDLRVPNATLEPSHDKYVMTNGRTRTLPNLYTHIFNI